jgi:glycosyltransferase involved in cell wall biosynthesis
MAVTGAADPTDDEVNGIRPLRILHVVATLNTSYGGPAVATPQMCFALAELGHTVTVVCGDRPPEGAKLPEHPRLSYHFHTRLPPRRWAFSWAVTKRLKRLLQATDLVEIHSLYYFTTWRAASLCRRFGLPYVIRPHGALNPYHFRRHGWKKRPYEKLIAFPALRAASAILCDSDLERDSVARLSVGRWLAVVPVGVRIPPARARAPGPPLTVLFLGRVTAKKRVDVVLRAVADAIALGADLRLSIVGPIDSELELPLKKLNDDLGLSRVTTFFGLVSDLSKLDHLSKAHVFALISDDESFALSALEAMAAGLVVVVSTRVGLAERAAPGRACLTADDTEQLARVLHELANDPGQCVALGSAARAFAEAEFSWSSRAAAITDLYELLLDRNMPRQDKPSQERKLT